MSRLVLLRVRGDRSKELEILVLVDGFLCDADDSAALASGVDRPQMDL
jgi:hypothetical protein